MKWESNNSLELAQILARETGAEVKSHEPLAPLTSWRVGGAADILVRPHSAEVATRVLEFLTLQRWPWTVLGSGTNVLVPDAGIRGVVVQLNRLSYCDELDSGIYRVGAGMQVPELVRICSDRGYSGMEDLAAIPGSVGGAVVMNAGAGSQCFSDVLRRICIVKKGSVYHLEPAQLDFGYRRSGIQADMVVLEAQIHLDYVGIQECRERRRAALQHRKQAQKVGMPNAGSVFRNPPGLSAWKVIDACGLRGFKLGGAQISPQHTNFIINTGTASAAEIQALIAHVQRKAYESSGIRLEPEVRFLSEGLNAYET